MVIGNLIWFPSVEGGSESKEQGLEEAMNVLFSYCVLLLIYPLLYIYECWAQLPCFLWASVKWVNICLAIQFELWTFFIKVYLVVKSPSCCCALCQNFLLRIRVHPAQKRNTARWRANVVCEKDEYVVGRSPRTVWRKVQKWAWQQHIDCQVECNQRDLWKRRQIHWNKQGGLNDLWSNMRSNCFLLLNILAFSLFSNFHKWNVNYSCLDSDSLWKYV